jgi:hypothetical protein
MRGQGRCRKNHDDEDQSTLQRGTLGVGQERDGEAELHRVAHNRNRGPPTLLPLDGLKRVAVRQTPRAVSQSPLLVAGLLHLAG